MYHGVAIEGGKNSGDSNLRYPSGFSDSVKMALRQSPCLPYRQHSQFLDDQSTLAHRVPHAQ
jgi:hypothetical protein